MKTWFITGASRGLGSATALAAMAAGDRVVATGRDETTVAAALGPDSDTLLALRLDVTDQGSIDAAFDATTTRFGGVDVLVNNAGYGQLGAFEEISAAAVERQFATNVFGVFAVTRALLPSMRSRRSGHIITISSMVGAVGVEGGSIYAATKFAVSGWSESLSHELARFGIKATAVYPGYFRTDFLDRSSMRLADLTVDDYREATGKATARRDKVNHRQAGDPAAFGRAMVELAASAEPPPWFIAGRDSVQTISRRNGAFAEALHAWNELSVSTDLPDGS